MSLLLEALKKAEDDMRRRRPGGMLLQQDLPEATANATPASGADEMLQAPVAAPDVPEPTPPAVPPAVLDPFPELSLSAMEPPPEPVAPPHIPSQVLPSQAPAVPAPFAAAAPEVLVPVEPPVQASPHVPPAPPAAPSVAPSVAPARAAAAAPTIAEVRAKAAARLMGAPSASRAGRPNRRTLFLGGAAALVLLAFGGLWWWAEEQAAQPLMVARPAATPAAASRPDVTASAPLGVTESAPAGSSPTTAAAVAPVREPPVTQPSARQTPARSIAADRPRPAAERGVIAAQAPATKAVEPRLPTASPQTNSTTIDDLVLRRNPSLAGQRMQQAHADFQAGRTAAAAQIWQDILRTDPLQRDAWLGLAVLAHREGRRDEAVAAYRQVLRVAPENPEATAALSILTNAASDPMEESRLRELLARSPNNAMLNSALARMLSAQNRWDEAQPLWFNAHASAPDDPSHAFNLAVAMDRLRKPDLALTYYRKALSLGEGRPAGFDMNTARARVRALSAGADGAAKP